MVKVYTTPGCGGCRLTKKYLTEHGVEYEEVNIRESDEAREFLLSKNLMTAPIVQAGEEIWSGHDHDRLAALVDTLAA